MATPRLCSVQGRQKQLAADQLQYELSTQSRRASDETAALKHRLADVELQLAQTRREADEYYKSGLETNAQATSLRNQVRTEGRGLGLGLPQLVHPRR